VEKEGEKMKQTAFLIVASTFTPFTLKICFSDLITIGSSH
jgi:hypothetical protein